MNVKIECPCGTKFAFEVEPVNGEMPTPVACPSCGEDATEMANAAIRLMLSAKTTSGPVRVKVVTAGAGQAAPVTEETALEPEVERCSKHPREMAVARCEVCQKPICARCMEMFGFLCSVYCQEQAARKKIEVRAYSGQKTRVEAASRLKVRRVLIGLAAVMALFLGVWGWYFFAGSKPRVTYTVMAESGESVRQARWVGENQLAVLGARELSLHDLAQKRVLWSATLQPDEQTKPRAKDDDSSGQISDAMGQMLVRKDAIWLAFPARVVLYDARTGKREFDAPLPQSVQHTYLTDSAIVAVSPAVSNQVLLTRVDLANRRVQTDLVPPSPLLRPTRDTLSTLLGNKDGLDLEIELRDDVSEFIPSGGGVAHLAVRVTQPRIVSSQEAKTELEVDRIIDRPNVRAADSDAAVAAYMRDTAPVKGGIDESRYRVAVRRFGGAGSSWYADVTGPPALFALQTVDLFTAGKSLLVFSKAGEKQWEAKLTYPISRHYFDSPEAGDAPGFEAGGRLYFWDQGVMTAFDLKNGQVHWRLNTVGISEARLGQRGRLYVCGTTAAPDSIPRSTPLKFGEGINPLIVCVDSGTGKALWQRDWIGEHAHVAGKFVYVSRTQTSTVDMIAAGSNNDDNVPLHHRIYRLDPDTGKHFWEYYQPRPPIFMDARQNRLLLQYRDVVRVLSFHSL